MSGPVLHGGHRVSWASRTGSIDPPPTRRVKTGAGVSTPLGQPYFSSPGEGNRYDESPLSFGTPAAASPMAPRARNSAPPVLHAPHRPLSKLSDNVPRHGELSYDETRAPPVVPAILATMDEDVGGFKLDASAPRRAMKHRTEETSYADAEGIRRWDVAVGDSLLGSVKEEEDLARTPADVTASKPNGHANAPPDEKGESEDQTLWGESFEIQWIETARLPFCHTRHLRNPWNHDREVKVSRDGTELEPTVGQALLEAWDTRDSQKH